jgi:hypothetical protein
MGGKCPRRCRIKPHQPPAHARLGQIEWQDEITMILGHHANMAIGKAVSSSMEA